MTLSLLCIFLFIGQELDFVVPFLVADGTLQKTGRVMMILKDGSIYDDKFITCVFTPGYRGVGLEILVDNGASRETVFLRFNKKESLLIAEEIKKVHEAAWQNGKPSDFQQEEKKPDWIL